VPACDKALFRAASFSRTFQILKDLLLNSRLSIVKAAGNSIQRLIAAFSLK